MKNLSILLTVLSIGTSPLVATESSASDKKIEQLAQAQQKLGAQAIAEIRAKYENGDYNLFLKELDESYQAARDKNQLTQFIEMREGLADDWQKWDEQARKLQELKGRELIAAMETENDSIFKQKVLSAADNTATAEQDSALFRIATLRQMAPGTGANSDENKLIDLDLEYEYKALHISMPGKPVADLKEKQIVLRMEKAQKMVDLSMAFEDASLKKDVVLYVQELDHRLAQNWDTIDLNMLVNGKQKPENSAEEKVALILTQYQEKFSDLAKKFIAEQEKK